MIESGSLRMILLPLGTIFQHQRLSPPNVEKGFLMAHVGASIFLRVSFI